MFAALTPTISSYFTQFFIINFTLLLLCWPMRLVKCSVGRLYPMKNTYKRYISVSNR